MESIISQIRNYCELVENPVDDRGTGALEFGASAEASLPSSSPHSNVTDSVQQAAPTEGSFGSHQLLGMLSTTKQIPGNVTGMLSATKQIPGNITDSNNTQLNEPSNITYHSSAGYDSSSAIIGACVFAFIVLSMGSFIAFVYKKHKGNFCWWLRSARRRNAAAISLSKCMQQYISNPNYYSTSLDTPLLGMRQLQIPPDSVVLLEEIGEGYFGKVHKGILTSSNGNIRPVAVKTLKETLIKTPRLISKEKSKLCPRLLMKIF
ncbi:uncharacterized protein CDAR_463491 [Caerostris darwini]|uniref:Uncharacterized protein n=1 Tax=Caerostris darwini TaxID=1538125 RepID=A0AAV4RMK4_9ARAC|nr:uncharacterized protein CDAR_463491 [Caerostris darwini]